MKQLIIGLALTALLVGCNEKPKFSINKDDTLETYANDPAFAKIIPGMPQIVAGYKFTGAPASVYGIKTSDLDILGGYMIFLDNSEKDGSFIGVTLKGKSSFYNLKNRMDKLGILKNYDCESWGMEKDYGFLCNDKMKNSTKRISLLYDPFTETSGLTMTILN